MKVHWWEDSVARHTCHENKRGMTFVESYLGELVRDGGKWHYMLSGSCTLSEPYDNIQRARQALEKAVDGEPMYTSD